MQKHTKRQVKGNLKKDAFISDVCHRCLCFISDQYKSNVGFCGEGKTGVPGEKPLGAE